jgi:hypothetical protein
MPARERYTRAILIAVVASTSCLELSSPRSSSPRTKNLAVHEVSGIAHEDTRREAGLLSLGAFLPQYLGHGQVDCPRRMCCLDPFPSCASTPNSPCSEVFFLELASRLLRLQQGILDRPAMARVAKTSPSGVSSVVAPFFVVVGGYDDEVNFVPELLDEPGEALARRDTLPTRNSNSPRDGVCPQPASPESGGSNISSPISSSDAPLRIGCLAADQSSPSASRPPPRKKPHVVPPLNVIALQS